MGTHRRTVTSFIGTFLKPEMWHVYNQVTGLRRFRSAVLTRERQNAEMFPFDEVHHVRSGRTPWWKHCWLKYAKREPKAVYRGMIPTLIDQLRELETDVLHVYFGHEATRLALLLSHWKRPSVVSFHGADLGVYVRRPNDIRWLPTVFASARLLLVRCEYFIRQLVELGCPEEKIRLNRTHIRLDFFNETLRPAPPDGSWRLVQACRLLPKKGVLTSIRAFSEFRRAFPNATLTVAGDGPQLAELQREVASLGLGGKVSFTGFLGREALRDLYRGAHFFLHPSAVGSDNDIEGIPNALLEAMATGLVCASTAHAGIPEAMRDGVDGLLVAPDAPDRTAAALIGVARDIGRYGALSASAAARIRDEFSYEKQMGVLESIYEEALDSKTPAHS